MTKDVSGRVGKPTGLSSPTEPQSSQGLGPTGFDPSRDGLEMVARGLWLAAASCRDKEAVWLRLKANDREPYMRGARAAIAALREMGKAGSGSWCFHAARAAQVAKQKIVWALGGSDIHVGDDEIFIACLDAIAPCDSDGSRNGRDREDGLDAKRDSAGPQGIAQDPPHE